MPEELNFEIEELKKQYPEVVEVIDPEILEFITSEKFLSDIAQICEDNEITNEDQVNKIAYVVTLSLFGIIPKEKMLRIIERGAGIEPKTAEKMRLELNRLIFSQFRVPTERPETTEIPPAATGEIETEKKRSKRKDVYRESVG